MRITLSSASLRIALTRAGVALFFILLSSYSFAAEVSTFTLTGSVVGGSAQQFNGTVTISRGENDDSDVTVFLSGGHDLVAPGYVIVPAGESTISFTVGATVVTSPQVNTIYASTFAGVQSVSATVTVTPLTLTISVGGSLVGGSTDLVTGTLTLNAPSGGGSFGLGYSGSINGPGSVAIAVGQSSATFQVYAPSQVNDESTGHISATYGPISSNLADVSVEPVSVSMSAPGVLYAGEDSKATVSIGTTSAGGIIVSFSSTGQGIIAQSPGNVVIPNGKSSATIAISASAVSQITTFIFKASTDENDTASTPITVLPGGVPPPSKSPNLRCCGEGQAGMPIDLFNGNVWVDQTDFVLPGLGGGIHLTRTWNSLFAGSIYGETPAIDPVGMFGHSWRTNYEERLQLAAGGVTKYYSSTGNVVSYTYDSTGNTYTILQPQNFRAVLSYNSTTNQRTLTFVDGVKKVFDSNGNLVSIIDRNGNITSLSYDTYSRLSHVTDPSSRTLTFNYPGTSDHLVSSISDATGTIAQYTYGNHDVLSSVTYADSSVVNFAYSDPPCDPNGQGVPCVGQGPRITSITDGQNKVLESHDYDTWNRGTSSSAAGGAGAINVTYPSINQTVLTDSNGNSSTLNSISYAGYMVVDSITGNGCASCGFSGPATFGYDSSGNRTSAFDAAGHYQTWNYDIDGNMYAHDVQLDTNVTPAQVSFLFNGFGEVLTATDPSGKVTTNQYDTNGNLTSSRGPSPDGTAPGPLTSYTYYSNGQLHTISDPRGKVTTFTYNTVGLVSSVQDPTGATTSFGYDARGNRTSVTDALLHGTTYSYDVMNRLTKVTRSDTSHTDFGYDYRGRRTSLTDFNGKVTSSEYDDANRLTKVTDPNLHATTYTYDTENNLKTIKDALNRVTSYDYDSLSRLTKTTFPSTKYETYEYDSVNNLHKKTDRKGQVITYDYDFAHRLKTKTYPDSTTVNYTYDRNSRLTQVVDPSGTYQFTYDYLGRQTQASSQYAFLTSRTLAVKSEYDAGSNRTKMTNPENSVWEYSYDDNSRLTGIVDDSMSQSFGFGYDDLGRRTSLTRPAGSNSFNTTYSYDTFSRLTGISHGSAMSFAYGYDPVGNRTSETYVYSSQVTSNYVPGGSGSGSGIDPGAPPSGVSGTASSVGFEWEDPADVNKHILNRIERRDRTNVVLQPDTNGVLKVAPSDTKLTYTFSQSADGVTYRYATTTTANYAYDDGYQLITAGRKSYTYDGVGNRTSEGQSYNSSNQLTSANGATYTYDDNGNLATKVVGGVTTTYAWDFENRLISIGAGGGATTTFKYDPFGRRIQKNGEVYAYDGANLIEVLNASGVVQGEYTFGPGLDEVLAKNDDLYYADGHRSVRMIANKSDAKQLVIYTYDAYGNTTVSGRNLAMADRFRYSGRELDSETGVYYYRARYYDATAGRFISEDPKSFGGGSNFYAYVGNSPIGFIDPYGTDGLQDFGNTAAGYSDHLTFGLTKYIRVKMGTDQFVDQCSLQYRLGGYAGNLSQLVFIGAAMEAFSAGAAGVEAAGTEAAGAEATGVNVAETGAADGLPTLNNLNAQLRVESANSVFTESGALTDDAIANSRQIIDPAGINNPNVPSGFGKFSTQTYQSPVGDFQTHFYMNPSTGETFYGLDYKVIFNDSIRFIK